MKISFLKTSCFVLFVVVAFVYFANPIYAKASTADMDYIETDLSTAEVKALFSGAAAFIPAAFVIIGFIALMYCTLRNVNTPVQFSSSDSFIDKCRSLGQYCVDNCTDALKNVLYSVYEYCEDNNITSITGFGSFLALNIGKFISAFSAWINGSLINNVSDVGEGLLNSLSGNPFSELNYMDDSTYQDYLNYYHSNIPSLDLNYCLGFISGFNYGQPVYYNYLLNTISRSLYLGFNVISSTSFQIIFYSFNNNVLTKTSSYCAYYNNLTLLDGFFSNLNISSDYGFSPNLFNSLIYTLGFNVFTADSYDNTLSIDDINLVLPIDLTSPASDNVYVPQASAIPIDLVGTWSDLADALAHGGDAADVTQEEKIAAYVPADVALQLDSAVSDTINVIGGGNYVFPSLKGVWKYAEYFFNTLKGWGQFVGGCLNAVTVGEGGLSWLFYGGFIILVCGGVVGKILLG